MQEVRLLAVTGDVIQRVLYYGGGRLGAVNLTMQGANPCRLPSNLGKSRYFEEERDTVDGCTILDSKWYSSGQGYLGMQIGVVAVQFAGHASGEWQACIGIGHGLHKESDEIEIAEYGAVLPAREAAGFFPQLDIQRYRRI